MSVFEYLTPDGDVLEREYAIGCAPREIKHNGQRCPRKISAPALVGLSDDFKQGRKAMRSRQLPRYYGYRQYDACWAEHMRGVRLDGKPVEDNKANRMAVLQAGKGPSLKAQHERAKKNAEKAGALDSFDKKGRPIAHTMRGVANHVAKGREMGDAISWS